jgi:hypothetical protein
MTANRTLHHEKTALLKATSILNGTPILISRKIASRKPETKLHALDIVSFELFSAKKKIVHLNSTPIQTTTLNSIREQDHEYNAPLSPLTAIRPISHRESEDFAGQLLTALDGSLGKKAILPTCEGHRVYMHYTDNKVSPEERMAKMARYACNPAKATDAVKSKG